MNIDMSTDPRVKRWGNVAKFAALIVVGFVVAPFIFTALTGLIGLILAGGLLTATWMFLPAIEAGAANIRLKMIKKEAARNPIETLQNDLREKTVALDSRKTAIEELNGKIRTFADRVNKIKDEYGATDSAYLKLNGDLSDLRRIYANRCEKWKQAKAQLDKFAESIDRGKMIWEAGLAAAAARESSGLTEDDFYQRLRTETAFDAIQDGYNQALASLDTSLMDEPVALPARNPNNVIDINAVEMKAKV